MFRVMRFLFQFPTTLFRMRQFVEFSDQACVQLRKIRRFDPVWWTRRTRRLT